MAEEQKNLARVQIGEELIEKLLYKDIPVVTFTMIHDIHGTPLHTLQQAFKRNRKHFKVGKDYFHLDFAEASQIVRNVPISPRGFIILTKSGYLLLIKPLRDDESWRIQAQMIDEYFALLAERDRPTGMLEVLVSKQRISREAYIEVEGGEKIFLSRIPHALWKIESEMRGLPLYQRESKRYRLHGNAMSQVAHVWVPHHVLAHIRQMKPEGDTVGQWMVPDIRLRMLHQLNGAIELAAAIAQQEQHSCQDEAYQRYAELRNLYMAKVGMTAAIPGTTQQLRVLGEGEYRIEQRQLALFG